MALRIFQDCARTESVLKQFRNAVFVGLGSGASATFALPKYPGLKDKAYSVNSVPLRGYVLGKLYYFN